MTEMNQPVETAAGTRGLSTFPDAWGTPPGTPHSEERAAWVRGHTRLEQVRHMTPEGERRRLVRAQDRQLEALRNLVGWMRGDGS